MIVPNPLLGTGLHAIGASCASVCYVPQKGVKAWSWQSYWLAQSLFCWFILPLLCAWLFIPDLGAVIAAASPKLMLQIFLMGFAYGIGGTAFGISIRFIGYSLTYAIAVGLSTVLGTLLPLVVSGKLASTFAQDGAGYILVAILIGVFGIAMTGVAGRIRENELAEQGGASEFSILKGLLLSLIAGSLSAVYGIALGLGEPIAEIARQHGGAENSGLVVYVFTNTGAFISSTIYCTYLHMRDKTAGELFSLPKGEGASLSKNWALALLTGCLWYGQFFFYNLGHIRMGTYKFTSWAIHMIMLILFSLLVGVVMKEWNGAQTKTKGLVVTAFALLTAAVLFMTYGNYLGSSA